MVLPKKGSKGEVTFEETIIDPRYFTSAYFSQELPVISKELTFIVPRWMKMDLKEYNFAGNNIAKATSYDSREDADVITFTAHNLSAEKTEPNSPGPSYLYPHIMVLCKSAVTNNHSFTYFATLDDQYAWYRQLVKSINNKNDVISARAKELTVGLSSDLDKIKAVFYYVQDNIRYIAFENGVAGFKPESADEVLRKKYGDCKGMANLTKSLLASLGYDARLCWLGTDHIAYDYQTPSMAVDNHMICALNLKGKMIYLDATESYLGINEYAERIQGRQVLVENGDKYLLSRIPLAAAAQNCDNETSKLTFDGASLKGNVDHLWKGEEKEFVLSSLNAIKKENTDKAMLDYLANSNADYEIKDLKLSSTSNPDKDLVAAYAVNYKNAVSIFSKAYYVDLDFKKELINSAIKIDERKHDYWFDYKTNISKETELAIPANYKVSTIPAALDIVNPDYEFHVQYQNRTGKLIYKKSILIKNTHLPVSKFAQWNRDIEQLAKTYNETVTLKPANE
jgi:transglutaminase-like putative cysteine protease